MPETEEQRVDREQAWDNGYDSYPSKACPHTKGSLKAQSWWLGHATAMSNELENDMAD